jgi:DNA polymerase-3 subunit alpha
VAQASDGAEAFRMVGVVRRRQERTSAGRGEKFAFVTLSDPSGEYEVMFLPEGLRKCRDLLEPGRQVVITARAKGRDGEVRFFGDDAEPIDRIVTSNAASLRIHISSAAANMEALRKRLRPADTERGGEVSVIAGVLEGCEVELKLPGRFVLDSSVRSALKTAPGVMYLEDV